MDYTCPQMEETPTDGENLPGAGGKGIKESMVARELRNRKKGFFRYLTYSEEDEKWQLVCTDAGHNVTGPYTVYPPHKEGHPRPFQSVAVGRTLTEYQIIYITQGRGIFECNQRTHVVVPGSIILIFPGVRHFYKPEYEVGWTEYWVGFKGPYADTLCEKGFLSPKKPLYDVGLQDGLLSIYTKIFELVQSQRPLYQLRASAHVLTLISEILAHERRSVQYSHSEQLVERAKFLMEENIYDEINLNAIGEALCVSTSHLNEVFKSYTAMTPYQYYISIKIRKAKELLEGGELAIKEVAFKLGFEDQYYFSRLFRKKTGIPPSHWSPFVRR
jgi:AraC-like DNA-binding protein/mannose-6-phosphate isomerase-like protein (cupin superfamily)